MRKGRTSSMVLGGSDRHGKARQKKKRFLDIPSKQYLHANLKRVRNCTSGLFFFLGLGNSFFLDFLGHRLFLSFLSRSFSFFWF